MAYLPESAVWEDGIYQLETTDEAEGGVNGTANLQAKQLANRVVWLRQNLDMSVIGEVLVFNRGIVFGCEIEPSLTATRNVNIASGRIFRDGGEQVIPVQTNAAVVPSNPGGSAAEAFVVLNEAGELTVTELNGQPDTNVDLVLAHLAIPAGSTEVTAPNLEDVTVTLMARVEPGWPLLVSDPPVGHVVVTNPEAQSYAVFLDEDDSSYGDATQHGAVVGAKVINRAALSFDIAILGTADRCRVRFQVRLQP